ncbi:MAG TPA: hypothetical protein VGS17_13040, partial [Candidatus Limnocylindria bacterium]|nr:hypothetical protein [Candidatus Limnocylindria bacterium]
GTNGLALAYDRTASAALLTDLRSDAGMGWIPATGWLSQLRIDTVASTLTYDLAVDAAGRSPSRVAAGFETPRSSDPTPIALTMLAAAMAALILVVIRERRRTVPA